MKELLIRMAHFNAWANERFIGLLLTMDDTALDLEIVSSFPSIRKTVLHIWASEEIWLQRFEGVPKPSWKAAGFTGSMQEACNDWKQASAALVRFTEGQDETGGLSRIVTGINLRGEAFADALDACLQHVFNHGTFHRGQLVTMLRQAGATAIPQTDLIAFTRSMGL